MPKPTWIIESKVFAEASFDEMIAHLTATETPHHIVRIIPFVHEIDGPVPQVSGPVVCYGSIGVQKLSKAQGWSPGVFTDDETFRLSTYIDELDDLMVNDTIAVMPLSEVAEYLIEPDPEIVQDDRFFIKPNSDNKEFAGTVMSVGEFGAWHAEMMSIGYLDTDDFDVVLSPMKELGCEWRVVVVDGKIVTSSLYKQYQTVRPERHILPEVAALVMEAHARFVPAPVYVIDIAQVGDAYKIIEYNTFNSAGFYAGDVPAIIDAISAYFDHD